VLSWHINRNISISLLFIELDKGGISNADAQYDSHEKFNKIFGFDSLKSLVANQEFIGAKLFKKLHKHNLSYFIRV